MVLEDVSKEQLGSVWGRGSCPGGGKVDHFGKGVDKYYYGIIPTSSLGELCDEVHRDLFPGSLWYG